MAYINRGFASGLRGSSSANHHALSNEELARLAPSIFAAEPHASRSARYTYIPTVEVLDGMRANGFFPVEARQGWCRVPGKADFTKHLIRFQLAGDVVTREIGALYPEVALVNSHDGTSKYHVMSALKRMICLNGLLVDHGDLTSVQVPHKGNVTDRVIEGSFTVISESRKAITTAHNWAQIELNRDDRQVLAEAVHELRFADNEGGVTTAIRPEQMLAPRRADDRGSDMWRTVNVLQENAIRGGLSAMGRDANGRQRQQSSRAIHGIDQDVKLNRGIWRLAEYFAQQKQAA